MHRQLNLNGKQIHYQYEGSGPAVVLLHGFGEDSTIWDFQKVLANQFTLLIPDLPGSGNSEMIADMSLEGLAEVVYTILKHENVNKCVLIGHSMGGYVALAFAEKYEQMLSGLGLFHSSAFADTAEKIETRKKGITFITEQGAAEFLKTTSPNLYSPATKEKHPALITEQVEAMSGITKEALVAYYEAMIQRPDRTVVLRELTVPVLFVLGEWDTAVPLQTGLAQCHLPQIASIHLLSGSGHMGMVEEPELSTGILQKFVTETLSML